MSERKDRMILVCMVLAFGILTASAAAAALEHGYSQRSFQLLSAVCQEMIESDPETEQAVMSALKTYSLGHRIPFENSRILAYGYGPADFFQSDRIHVTVLAACGVLAGGSLFLAAVFWRDRREKSRILALTEDLKQVNQGRGSILPQRKEDAFSRLQDEIYKTVTELYQTREAAVEARNLFAENLANIAHQIKTPLTAMDLSVQVMEGQAVSKQGYEQTVLRTVNQMRRQLQRLTCLEEALLLLSRMDAGTLPVKRKKVDVFTVLMLAADNLQEFSDKAGVSVDIPEAGEVSVCADLDWTVEAVMNILKNCMEHTPSGGMILCRYEQNPLYTEIRIQDTGPGFQKEDLPHLFERFYRGQNAKEASIGIGLSLARGIIERQNGTICAGNLPEGGACFEIRFYSH